MPPQPLTMNPNYLAMVRGVRELHLLMSKGKDDSPEADAIRDATDAPWESLSEIERRRVRNLSEDLYSLHEAAAPAQQSNPQAQSKLGDALEARKQGDWDRALDLLRRWGSYLDPALVSYFRGAVWLEAGDPATAALFFGHASKLRPENENYPAMFLHALELSDADAARKQAEEILQEPDKSPPVVIARVAGIEFNSLKTASETEANKRLQRLVAILEKALARFDEGEASAVDRSSYVMTISLLGFAHEFLGEAKLALENYSRGLQIDPTNDALLVARGILRYGTSERAITDFEMAIQYRSPVIWPYFFLAHHRLTNGRFEDCRRLCEQALNMPGSAAVKSELSEWMAIAQSELGFPIEMVRASFENAIRLDPSNERAGRNLAAFEAAVRPTMKTWETRSSAAVRLSGLAERRYAMAA
jgi:tetratricopeptide (TPR) repeat protein